MNTAELTDRLEGHYRRPGTEEPGELLFREVAAPSSARRADLVRVGLWASRSPGVDVHEIKTSRADWLRELADPAKAEAWYGHCNRWWIVVTDDSIVRAGELPAGWGLLLPPKQSRHRRFRVAVAAEDRREVALSLDLLGTLMKRRENQWLKRMRDTLEQERQTHREQLRTAVENVRGHGVPPEAQARLDALSDVEDALGLEVHQWSTTADGDRRRVSPEQFAEAVRHVAAHGADLAAARRNVTSTVAMLRRTLNRTQTQLDEADQQLGSTEG